MAFERRHHILLRRVCCVVYEVIRRIEHVSGIKECTQWRIVESGAIVTRIPRPPHIEPAETPVRIAYSLHVDGIVPLARIHDILFLLDTCRIPGR